MKAMDGILAEPGGEIGTLICVSNVGRLIRPASATFGTGGALGSATARNDTVSRAHLREDTTP
jgi:hypothetical protein